MSFVESVHELIHQRRSVGLLTAPAPQPEQLDLAFAAAWVAPDHRRLKPTRFVVIEEHQREAFAEMWVQAYIHETGCQDADQLEKVRLQPMRAPVLVVVLTELQTHEKVPDFEQLLSTGAAVQNVLLSLQAQGFASIWRSGELVESIYLKQQFGLRACDYIAGILYVGTAQKALPARKDDRDSKPDFVRYWQG